MKSPQDGSADAVVSLVLGSSYVVYHAAALTRLQDFFRTEQVRGNCSALHSVLPAMPAVHGSLCPRVSGHQQTDQGSRQLEIVHGSG